MKILILKKDAKKGFLLLQGINRPIIPNHVTKLAGSVQKMGCLRPVIIARIKFLTGKEESYIIDGQHLFNALLRNNQDIPYMEIAIKDKTELVESIALLNASSKTWAMVDYVTAWGSIYTDYKRLHEYYNIYDFDMSILASVLSNNTGTSGGTINTKIKKGEFRIVNEKENLLILDHLTDILKIAPRMNRFENKYLCTEYVSFVRNNARSYNHSMFIVGLEKRKRELILSTQEVGKLKELFEKINK